MQATPEEVCKRESLRIVVNIPSYWGVNDDGTIDCGDHYGEGDADVDNFDSYCCAYCGMFFTKDEDNHDAWKDALAHLSRQG